MIKTYRNFRTRNEFIDYLNLYPKHPTGRPDFVKLANIPPECYQQELEAILKNINHVKQDWNNQSINDIERSVAKKGQKQLDIMEAQRQEKLQAGYGLEQPMYRIKNCEPESYFNKFAEDIGLEYSQSRYHVQFPGEVTAWHTDIFSPTHEFLVDYDDDQDDEFVGKDKNIRRIMIALQPWQRGHFLQFGYTPWIDWSAGDVIGWDYGVPHGSANMGYEPRISVSITGKITDKFAALNNHARKL